MSTMSFLNIESKIWEAKQCILPRHASLICKFDWSPHVFKDGIRRRENWISSDYIVVLFSPGDLPIRKAKKAVKGVAHILAMMPDRSLGLIVRLAETQTDLRKYQAMRRTLLDMLPPESPPTESPACYPPAWGIEAQDGYAWSCE